MQGTPLGLGSALQTEVQASCSSAALQHHRFCGLWLKYGGWQPGALVAVSRSHGRPAEAEGSEPCHPSI